MIDILTPVLQHDEQAVLIAVELALAEGVPTKTHVLNLLHRLVDGKVAAGRHLRPRRRWPCTASPRADVKCHDGLWTRTPGGRHAS